MKLLDNWQHILKYAWSIKFNALSIVFCGLEVYVQASGTADVHNGLFAMLAGGVSFLSAMFRLLAQKEITK